MKTIEGVPEQISHEQHQAAVDAACGALGIDKSAVRSVKLGMEYIELEAVALDADGHVTVRSDVDRAANHVITYICRAPFVPVRDPETDG